MMSCELVDLEQRGDEVDEQQASTVLSRTVEEVVEYVHDVERRVEGEEHGKLMIVATLVEAPDDLEARIVRRLLEASKKRNFCKLDFTLFVKSIGQNLDKIQITFKDQHRKNLVVQMGKILS
jgi:hypothetical protein